MNNAFDLSLVLQLPEYRLPRQVGLPPFRAQYDFRMGFGEREEDLECPPINWGYTAEMYSSRLGGIWVWR